MTLGDGTIFEASDESRKQIRQFFPDEAKSVEEFLVSYAEELERRKNKTLY